MKYLKLLLIILITFPTLLLLGNWASFHFFGASLFKVFNMRALDSVYIHLTCVGKNKEVMEYGFMANPVCVTRYSDEGKPCTSSQECMSKLCVLTNNNPHSNCRGISSDYPLCSNGEATVEYVQKVKAQARNYRFTPGPFVFCD